MSGDFPPTSDPLPICMHDTKNQTKCTTLADTAPYICHLSYEIMKLTPELRLLILEKVGIYSARFSIEEPGVLLTTREVLDAPREMTEGRRTSAYKYYGVAYLQHKTVFINVRKIPDQKVLENTIVHELVHLRFPYMSHGKRFNALVRRGLRGARFAPYKKRSRRQTRSQKADRRR